jgi:SAM-dependent MidA family methyltransferase
MELSLYDKDIGYYSSGKVQFGYRADFLTWPIMASPEFGQLAVKQAFTMWQSMLAARDIGKNETFTILELGAGNGRLANDMLNAARQYSQHDPQWAEFYSLLQYRIIELSPELQTLQKECLAEYGVKVIVQTGDARSVSSLPRKSLKGLVFTNELPDAFPVHRTCVQPDRTVLVQIVIPYLESYGLDELGARYSIDSDALEARSDALKQKFGAFLNNELSKKIVISSQDLKKIIQTLDNRKGETGRFFHCYTIGVPVRFFPEVQDYCRRHQTSIDLLQPSTHMSVNLGMRTFIENIASILNKGFMTTIDYGYADRAWSSPLAASARIPRFYPTNRLDTQHISSCDITTDIPWTQFTREGAVYFNDPVLREQTALGDPHHPRWAESTDFKMHIQRVKGTQASYRPPKGRDLPLV